MKQPLKKTLVVIVVLVFTTFTIASCGLSNESTKEMVTQENTWDSIKALPEDMQPAVLPKVKNLNTYATLRSFASITPEIEARTPYEVSGNYENVGWNPESCYAAAEYVGYDANTEIADSEFARSLGQGWQQVFLDDKRGKTLSFSIFSDLGASDKSLIEILERDIKTCPIASAKIGDVTWNYEFEVRRDSAITITIITQISNSKGFVGNSLKSINQVGRNVLASYLVLFDWNGNAPPPVSAEQERDLISAWTVMATKVLAQKAED